MTKEEIMEAIKGLAKSQGFYGRLYEHLKEDENLLDYIYMHNIKDTVDIDAKRRSGAFVNSTLETLFPPSLSSR